MSTKQSLDFNVPVEQIEQVTAKVVEQLRAKARLPGFRPGKVPPNIIRSRFASDIRREVLQEVVPKVLEERFEKENLNVVGEPDLKDVHFAAGEPLTFRAEFEVVPDFDLEEYRELEVTYGIPEVTDEQVTERLNELREQKAEFIPVDPRPLADGDHAVVSLESRGGIEGEPIRRDQLMLEIGGADTMEDFSNNLRGLSPDEEKEFDVTYPEEYAEERLAGKTVRFHCRVHGVRRKELPEINDEFAKDLGDYQNLDELRNTVHAGIRAEREFVAQHEAKNVLVGKLVEMHDFPVPEALIERQIENIVRSRLQELAGQGVDPRNLKIDWAKVKESQRDRAIHDVKGSLLLGRIAEREHIEVTQDDMDREIQRIARQRREPLAAVRKDLEENRQFGRIANSIRTDKTLNFLFEQARKVAPEE